MRHICKTCAHFEYEVRYGSGEPLDSVGNCSLRADYAAREADDWCKHYAVAEWAEEAEGGAV